MEKRELRALREKIRRRNDLRRQLESLESTREQVSEASYEQLKSRYERELAELEAAIGETQEAGEVERAELEEGRTGTGRAGVGRAGLRVGRWSVAAAVVVVVAAVGAFFAVARLGAEPAPQPMFGGNAARTGVYPESGATDFEEVAFAFETLGGVFSSPAVADGTVYVGSDDGRLYAVDTETGEEVWSFETGAPVSSSPAVIDNTVYIGSQVGRLHAVDAQTGDELWSSETGDYVGSSPVVADGMVYVGSRDGRLYGVDAETGERAWSFETEDEVFSSPAAAGGVVYVGSVDGRLYAVDMETGEEVWSYETDGEVASSPAVADGTVYVGSFDGRIYAVEADTGNELWSIETGDSVVSSPAVADGTVYVGSGDRRLYALDADTGSERWTFETGGLVASSPAIAVNTVYVGSGNGRLYALDPQTGEEKWSYETGDWVDSSPAVVGGMVYVGSGDGRLYAVDADNPDSPLVEVQSGPAEAAENALPDEGKLDEDQPGDLPVENDYTDNPWTDGEDLSGTEVQIFGYYTDSDARRFRAGFAPFIEETGIEVNYDGSFDFEEIVTLRAEGGDPPDIAAFPQPDLMEELYEGGYIHDVSDWFGMDYLEQQYAPSWIEMSMVDGDVAGVWFRTSLKSLVWYVPRIFAEAGYEIPETWNEMLALSDQMVQDGYTPWSIAMESSGSTGWVGTDWIEDVMLRIHEPEVYDQWVNHEIPFDSDEVREAFEVLGEIWFNEDYVLGGTDSILTVPFGDGINPLLADSPQALMHRQASFIRSFMPHGTEVGPDADVDFFYLPGIREEHGDPVLAAGDIMSPMQDRPEVRAVMRFLSTGESARGWIEEGGFVAPHEDVDLDWYPPLERRYAEIVADADTVRLDASDIMPSAVMEAFWDGMVDWTNGDSLNEVLPAIDAGFRE